MKNELYEKCLINLIKCSILNKMPDELPNDVDISVLYNIAMRHSVGNIIYEPLQKMEILDSKSNELFLKVYYLGIKNDAIQSHYLDLITDNFEKQEIPHCVMKGPVIKKLYPKSELRQSGDLDIYVPEEYREKAKAIMKNLGFNIERFNIEQADDVYYIENKIHVELHRVLVSNETTWQKECQKIVNRLILADRYNYQYIMTIEDYYLYMIAHMAKHMKYSGIGIKMILDVWIYMTKYNDELNWDILKKRLSDCGLDKFEENIRNLVGYWFENKEVNETVIRLGKYIFASGAFGTKEQLDAYFYTLDAGRSNNNTVIKLKYYTRFFFQPYKWMCGRYPILRKFPVLLPFCWVHRTLKTILFDREKTRSIAIKYDNINVEESRKIFEFKKEIGL